MARAALYTHRFHSDTLRTPQPEPHTSSLTADCSRAHRSLWFPHTDPPSFPTGASFLPSASPKSSASIIQGFFSSSSIMKVWELKVCRCTSSRGEPAERSASTAGSCNIDGSFTRQQQSPPLLLPGINPDPDFEIREEPRWTGRRSPEPMMGPRGEGQGEVTVQEPRQGVPGRTHPEPSSGTIQGSSWTPSDVFQSRFPDFLLLVPQVSTHPRLEHFSFQDPEEPPPSASLSSQPQAKVMALEQTSGDAILPPSRRCTLGGGAGVAVATLIPLSASADGSVSYAESPADLAFSGANGSRQAPSRRQQCETPQTHLWKSVAGGGGVGGGWRRKLHFPS